MSSSTTQTLTAPLQSLSLRGQSAEQTTAASATPAKTLAFRDDPDYKYRRFLPHHDPEFKLPPLEQFDHVDPAHKALTQADPQAFLKAATKREELTPSFGTELEGIQLHKLNTAEKEQLALFVAQRGVVVFRDQEFIDRSPEEQLEFGKFFGRLHVHPTSGNPKEFPEFHLVYRDNVKTHNEEPPARLTSSVWHSDVSYEAQPPGLTALYLFDSPSSGGDTGFADQRAAYQQLSPSFRAYLETLQVVHSGVEQADYSRKYLNGIVKREPVQNVHPLIRSHPVTNEKALYVNPQFSRYIVGLKVEESEAILNLLYNHIKAGADFQTRVRWKPRTVVLWDNRITAHTAIVDFAKQGARRHGARITPQAERPFLA